MKIIVGLGNPGKKYENTRHNIGFETLDILAEDLGIKVNVNRYHGLTGQGILGTEKVLLVKPLTYMNLSGECVQPLAAYYKLAPEDVLVICDDVNLPMGQLRIRLKGSAGGHNGLKSIIGRFGSDAFPRIRCGVGGAPEGMDLVDLVLAHYGSAEEKAVKAEEKLAAEAARCFLEYGAAKAMNDYNKRISIDGEKL